MKLTYAAASPFVRKVMVLLEEANQRDAVELVDGFGSPVAPNDNAIAANPLGKIPCLVLTDGTSLYDSRVITRYLDELFNLSLYPDDESRWATLTLEAHADALLEAAVLCVYEHRCRDEDDRSAAWLNAQRGKITRALVAIENQWLPHLHGNMTIAHVGVACALEYLDFRQEMGGWPAWRATHLKLDAWSKEFSARPSMQATKPTV